MVLKLWLGADPKVTLEASLSAESVIEVKLASDYVLPVKEFASRDEPLELYHIPSKTTFNLPRHVRPYLHPICAFNGISNTAPCSHWYRH